MYDEEDYLQLSGLEHFSFCRRQWALIHIEQQWSDNYYTAEGNVLHEKAHSGKTEARGDIIITRSLAISSVELGLSGKCDIVEWHRDESGVALAGRKGLFRPMPVEYKRGKPDGNLLHEKLQLCAQAVCLEEMTGCSIDTAFLFYGDSHRRVEVALDTVLRAELTSMAKEMHELYRRQHTPRVKPGGKCKACSLSDICLPELGKTKSVSAYIAERLKEEP